MTASIRVMQVLEATAGGTRRHLRHVVSALETDEFSVHIVCAVDRDPAFREDVVDYRKRGHRVTILKMVSGISPLDDFLAVCRLRKLIKSEPCDILHLHSAKAGWLGRLAVRGLKCRVVYTPHAFPFLRLDAPIMRCAYLLAERITARWTDLLLAVSRAEGQIASDLGLFTTTRVQVLQNAVGVDDLNPSLSQVAQVRRPISEPRLFGLIGELRPQKGPLLFLEAVRRLRDRGEPIHIILPESGCELSRVLRFIERYDLGCLTDLIPASTSLASLLDRCDVAVLPSLWEGLPYSILDALAFRRPVIASDLPVFEDLLAPLDSRLTFPTGDVEALADRLALWARLPCSELEGVGARGRQLVIRNHDPDEWCLGLRQFYRSFTGAQD